MTDRKAGLVEKGLHLSSRSWPLPCEGYERLYIGDDFCERLAPDASGLEKILDFVRHNNKKLTLLTAYHTEKGLEILKPGLEALNSCGLEVEVVVNDLGVLRMLNNSFPNLIPVFGRLNTSILLHPYFRDERIFNPDGKILEVYRRKFWLAKEYVEFLCEHGIRRVEFDHAFALPLFADSFLKEGIAVSFYYPYTYITTSRRCLFASRNAPSSKFALLSCKKECLDYKLLLENSDLGYKIFVRGNAQFMRGEIPGDIAAECGKWGVDRIVTFAV
jgi:hypothetical protein